MTSTCDDGAEYLRLISIDRAAELLDVSRPTLGALPIPRVRIGSRWKYRASDIEAFIRRCGIENAATIAKHEKEALRARFRAADQKIYARRRKDGRSDSDSASRV